MAIDATPTAPADPAIGSTATARRAGTVLFVVGSCCVIAGGLVAAVTRPLSFDDGSWLAAYLVLVGGAAQCAIGRAQQAFARPPVSGSRWWTQLACWNAGNALVVAGTLAATPLVVDVGGAALLVTLVLALIAVARTPGRAMVWVYRLALAALVISIPVGLALAHLRAG